jgi:putative phosphoribosyl transferase
VSPVGWRPVPGRGARAFVDRADAGRQLAEAFCEVWTPQDRADLLLLGLPRGGVIVAAAAAAALSQPLDAVAVRKISLPRNPEVAAGAFAAGGEPVINESVVRAEELRPADLDVLVAAAVEGVRGDEARYRPGRGPLVVAGRSVVLIDDGAATGATMRAAVQAMRLGRAARVAVALPVAPRETLALLEQVADEVICLQTPLMFRAVGWAYSSFAPPSSEQVARALSGRGESGRGESGRSPSGRSPSGPAPR